MEADRRLHPRTGDLISFLNFECVSRVGWGPMLSRVPALLAKAEKPIRICVTQGGTSCPQRVGKVTAALLPDIRTFGDSLAIVFRRSRST